MSSKWSRVVAMVAMMAAVCGLASAAACRREAVAPPPAPAPNVVVITIDTLRADRVGAYGYAAARTPVLDALARGGTRFDRAYAPAPITLTSHASLMTGRYPPGHGARHNGLRVKTDVPLLAELFQRAGFKTGAFVAAFPLDRRFGLERGFQTYGDRMPRVAGVPANERPGWMAVDEALAWLKTIDAARFFLWVHLFEPHAPYGQASDGRPASARYDDEIAEADRQTGRLIEAVRAKGDAVVVVAGDHGEAFGEHGEIAHSLFVYDTTLRVPLLFNGPGISAQVSESPVSLIDVAPTIARLAGLPPLDSDGVDLSPAFDGRPIPPRRLYAESFAPLLDFGWSPLRAVREEGWKYIDAPRPELFSVDRDPGESENVAAAEAVRVAAMRERVNGYSAAALEPSAVADREAAARLQALGYIGGGGGSREAARADPKDRTELAAAIARITSGEVHGEALERALRAVLVGRPGESTDEHAPRLRARRHRPLRRRDRLFREGHSARDAGGRSPSRPGAVPRAGAASRSCGGGAAHRGPCRAGQPGRPREPGHRVVGRGTSCRGGCPRSSARYRWIPTSTRRASTWRSPTRARGAARTRPAKPPSFCVACRPMPPQRPEVQRLLDTVGPV